MRFVLNIQVRLPGEWSQEQRADLVRRETEAAVELMHRKVLRRTFRIVGQLANFSIWEAATPEDLHAVLQHHYLAVLYASQQIQVIQRNVDSSVPVFEDEIVMKVPPGSGETH